MTYGQGDETPISEFRKELIKRYYGKEPVRIKGKNRRGADHLLKEENPHPNCLSRQGGLTALMLLKPLKD